MTSDPQDFTPRDRRLAALKPLVPDDMPNGYGVESPDCGEFEVYCPDCLCRVRTIIDRLFANGWWRRHHHQDRFAIFEEDEVDVARDCHYCGKALFITLTKAGKEYELDHFEALTDQELGRAPGYEIERLLFDLEEEIEPRVFALIDRFLTLKGRAL